MLTKCKAPVLKPKILNYADKIKPKALVLRPQISNYADTVQCMSRTHKHTQNIIQIRPDLLKTPCSQHTPERNEMATEKVTTMTGTSELPYTSRCPVI